MQYEYIKLLSTKNVDDALNEASLNPVQNKVVTEALNEKANRADIPAALPEAPASSKKFSGVSSGNQITRDFVFNKDANLDSFLESCFTDTIETSVPLYETYAYPHELGGELVTGNTIYLTGIYFDTSKNIDEWLETTYHSLVAEGIVSTYPILSLPNTLLAGPLGIHAFSSGEVDDNGYEIIRSYALVDMDLFQPIYITSTATEDDLAGFHSGYGVTSTGWQIDNWPAATNGYQEITVTRAYVDNLSEIISLYPAGTDLSVKPLVQAVKYEYETGNYAYLLVDGNAADSNISNVYYVSATNIDAFNTTAGTNFVEGWQADTVIDSTFAELLNRYFISIPSESFVGNLIINNNFYLRLKPDNSYEWADVRESVFPSVSRNNEVTPLISGENIPNTIYYDTSKDIDEYLAGLTYEDFQGIYIASIVTIVGKAFYEAGAMVAKMGDTYAIQVTSDNLLAGGTGLVYVSHNATEEVLTQLGTTQTGWQVSSDSFVQIKAQLGNLVIDQVDAGATFISSTPFEADYSKGLFLRTTANGQYNWESPFPEGKVPISVGEQLPTKIYFNTSFDIESYLMKSGATSENNVTIIETDGEGGILQTFRHEDGGYIIITNQKKNGSALFDICYISPYISENTLSQMESAGITVKKGWNLTSIELRDAVVGDVITVLTNNPIFVTRDATEEEYEKGLYLKLLEDGSRVWTPSTTELPEGGSADQVLTKTEDGAEWKSLTTVATTGSYNDLVDKPTNVSTFTNDVGYLTEHQDISSKADLVDGKVPTAQLPSYVDDVLEYDTYNSLPATGENGKIYVTLDTNRTYRWGGSTYVEISASLTLGETSATAYRGDYGKAAYDHSQTTSGNPHNVKYSDLADAPALIIPVTEDTANSTAGVWIGTASDITSYYTGLTILYKLPADCGENGTTLNINSLGAQTVYIRDLVPLSGECSKGDALFLRYDEAYMLGMGAWAVVGASSLNTDIKLRIGDALDSLDYTDYYTNKIVYTPNPDATYTYTFPQKSGTLAITDDVTLCHHSVAWTYTGTPTNLGGTTYQDKYELYIDFYDRNPSAYTTLSAALAAAVKQGATRSVTGIKTSIEGTATTHYSIYSLNRSASDEYSVAYNSSDYKGSVLLTTYLDLTVTDIVTTI